MATFALIAQDVNGDPFVSGNNINIVSGAVTPLIFQDSDGLLNNPAPGDFVSIGGTNYNYTFLGSGDVRGDPLQSAAFIRVDLGGGSFATYSIHLNPSPAQPSLQNGNTMLKVTNLDMVTSPPFPVPCFTPGTRILTVEGEVAVEELCVGDMVETRSGPRPVRWIGHRKISAAMLGFHPHLRPVRIAAGALGEGLPVRELRVSPQHRILLTEWRAELLFGEAEVLVPAKHLINDRDIQIDFECAEVEYIHLLFDRHETIYSEGLPSESLYPGEEVLDGLEREARDEVLELFPQLAGNGSTYGAASFLSLKAHEARVLIAR